MYEQAPDILDALSVAKELNVERLALADKTIKLSNEIVELNIKRGTISHTIIINLLLILLLTILLLIM